MTDQEASVRIVLSGVLAGIGLVSFVDETVFHQLLHWHHFYDGLIQHKVLGLHQIRYQVDIKAYDVTWNVAALIMIGIGAALLVRMRSRPSDRD